MRTLYEQTMDSLADILIRDYKLSPEEAMEMVMQSPVQEIFKQDPEVAAHTSNETWARDILDTRFEKG